MSTTVDKLLWLELLPKLEANNLLARVMQAMSAGESVDARSSSRSSADARSEPASTVASVDVPDEAFVTPEDKARKGCVKSTQRQTVPTLESAIHLSKALGPKGAKAETPQKQ